MIEISTIKERLDINYIYDFLKNAYWAKTRSKEDVEESINNSLCFGVYLERQQIGFARVVTDQVVFSYLMDVFIDERFRGKNYAVLLLKERAKF